MTGTSERLILGEGCIYSMNSQKTGLNNNVLVIGGSGSGKTWSVAEPRILETMTSSLICTLTKRRLVKKYASLMRDRGYDVLDLDFSKPEKSPWGYDPLRYVRSTEDITHLARSIVQGEHGGNFLADPYWDNAAVSLLAAEIGYVMAGAEQEGLPVSFSSIIALHGRLRIDSGRYDTIETSLDDDFAKMPLVGTFAPFALSCWKSFRSLPLRTASCVFGSLNVMLDGLFTKDVQCLMENIRQVDFSRIALKKTAVFVTSSAVNPALHRLVNLFSAQAFKTLFEFAEERPDGVLPVPIHMICDDFATGGRIVGFSEYISIFREKGISVTLLLQSESQLASMYGEANAITIINNCDTYIYLGGMDLRTAKDVSARANLPLEDILYMPIGKEIVFRRGQKPVMTDRYDIRHDPRWVELTEGVEKTQR